MLSTYDRDGVTVAELDRRPVNALDLELLGALMAAVERAEAPVVLTGAGRTFSAGFLPGYAVEKWQCLGHFSYNLSGFGIANSQS